MSAEQNHKGSHWPISILSSIASIVNIIVPLFLVRVLTPAEIGSFKIFFLYQTVVPVFSLAPGLISGLGYWIGQGERGRRAVQLSGLLILSAAFVMSLLALQLEGVLSLRFEWYGTEGELFALALLSSIAGRFFEEAAISAGRIWTGAIFFSSFELVRAVVVLAAGVIGRSVEAVLIAHVGIMTLKLLISYILAWKMALFRFCAEWNTFKDVWRYAAPVSLAWIFGIFVDYADQVILSTSITAADFAIYSIGCLMIPPLFAVEQSVSRVMIPRMSAAFAQNAPASAAKLYREAVGELAFLFLPAVAGLMVFSQPIITLLFTPQYMAAADFLVLFSLTYAALIIPFDAVARARGQAGWIVGAFITFSLISVALVYGGVMAAGAFGALGAAVLAKLVMRLYVVFHLRRSLNWKLSQFLPLHKLNRYALSSAALALLCELLREQFPSDLWWFLVCGPAFALFYLFFNLGTALGSKERLGPCKVLFVTQQLGVGGLERMVFTLSKALKEGSLCEPLVLAYDQAAHSPLVQQLQQLGVRVITFKKGRGFSWLAVLRLAKLVLGEGVRVLHAHNLGPLMYCCAVKACLFGGVKIVYTQHSLVHLADRRRYQWYERFFGRRADALVVVSQDLREQYRRWGWSEGSVELIENGVTFPEKILLQRAERLNLRSSLAQRLASKPAGGELAKHLDAFWVLYLARIFPAKGQDQALELWRQLAAEKRQKMVLLFVGPEGDEVFARRVKNEAKNLPLSEQVLFLGPSFEPEVWLNCADIFLSASEYEGMPLGVLEAAGAGVPLLLSRIPGHDNLVAGSNLYSLNSPAAGARALEEIVSKVEQGAPEWIEKLRASSEAVRCKFSVAAMRAAYERLYGTF